jgi:hypothetical protein
VCKGGILGGHFNCSKSDNCNEIVVDIFDCESRFFFFLLYASLVLNENMCIVYYETGSL